MSEYIEREKIQYHRNYQKDGAWFAYKAEIDRIPAADVAPVVHGRWIKHWIENFHTPWWKCSVCGGEGYKRDLFCSNCGAKMDESEDDDNE